MTNLYQFLTTLNRPGLLVRAARHGLKEYNRDRHLRQIFGADETPCSSAVARVLLEMEQHLEIRRREKIAGYSPRRHIDVLCALMAEATSLNAGLAQQESA